MREHFVPLPVQLCNNKSLKGIRHCRGQKVLMLVKIIRIQNWIESEQRAQRRPHPIHLKIIMIPHLK